MSKGSKALQGIFRSLEIYHRAPERAAAMDALYGTFIKSGDLAFDIGAHVGDRTLSFRRLGVRVVTLEPQPLAFRALRLIHGRDPDVTLKNMACGAAPGTIEMTINLANPTVSTASKDFITASKGAAGWEGQEWETVISVPCTTLDALIAEHGLPAFAKIDVEGFEADVLKGLSTPIPLLSFEFTTIQRDVACECLSIMANLGPYRFNYALGESQSLALDTPITAASMIEAVKNLPHNANSGDIYAVLA